MTTKEDAINTLKADKEKRKGFLSYPELKLKNKTGISDEEIQELKEEGLIIIHNGLNDNVITLP
jgi:hypothetical protein